MTEMRNIINHLTAHKTLSSEQAKAILSDLAQGRYSEIEMASFLTVYLMRSITVEELSGFRDALLEHCIPIDLGTTNTIDLCGTGGDGKDTFNISTLASFVTAGAGAKVAKHGNYAVSSACGSSNVLEYFGYQFTDKQDALRQQMEKAGICFLHAPLFNPAMKNVAPVRKTLRVKTFFNMLGPMVNPSNPQKQLVGVFSLELARLYGYLYQQSNKKFVILHSLDGYDEISLTGGFKVISNQNEQLVQPEDLALKRLNAEALKGGNTVAEASKIFIDVLEGRGSDAQNQVVLANAAYALQCYYSLNLTDAFELASESLQSGKALQAFKTLIDLSKN
jgi:anthranilate phosphoribosyltransferase